jgi:hypothetical protein
VGPTIILDKSAFQALSVAQTHELDRYFCVVVPPVLIIEILADLKRPRTQLAEARELVQQLARKIQPIGRVNVHYRSLCISGMLGGTIPMDGRAMIGNAHRVRAADGSHGIFVDVQPESKALTRWSFGRFDEAEEVLAGRAREAAREVDLEALRRQLHTGWDRRIKPSLPMVRQYVDRVLDMPAAQPILLEALIQEFSTIPEFDHWVIARWRSGEFSRVRDFAPYPFYYFRTVLIFQQALLHGLIGTRSTNKIDLEYFYYAPFASVFCSGDQFHTALAGEMLGEDQSFVPRESLKLALREVADERQQAREKDPERGEDIDPPSDSLIRRLWKKHSCEWPEYTSSATAQSSEEEDAELIAKMRSILDGVQEDRKNWPPPRRWPCP